MLAGGVLQRLRDPGQPDPITLLHLRRSLLRVDEILEAAHARAHQPGHGHRPGTPVQNRDRRRSLGHGVRWS